MGGFENEILTAADVHAPQITRKVKTEYSPAWMTDNTKTLICHCDFKKKAVETGPENSGVRSHFGHDPPCRKHMFDVLDCPHVSSNRPSGSHSAKKMFKICIPEVAFAASRQHILKVVLAGYFVILMLSI